MMKTDRTGNLSAPNVLSRRDYQEILLARMAGGDLYANELRLQIRRVDILMDAFREKPLYPARQACGRTPE